MEFIKRKKWLIVGILMSGIIAAALYAGLKKEADILVQRAQRIGYLQALKTVMDIAEKDGFVTLTDHDNNKQIKLILEKK